MLVAAAVGGLAGCAAPVFNPATNEPLSASTPLNMGARTDFMRENSIVLSLSGGGLRAAAFAHGVLTALESVKTAGGDLLDDVALISSVSGSSLTAAYYGVYGVAGGAGAVRANRRADVSRELRAASRGNRRDSPQTRGPAGLEFDRESRYSLPGPGAHRVHQARRWWPHRQFRGFHAADPPPGVGHPLRADDGARCRENPAAAPDRRGCVAGPERRLDAPRSWAKRRRSGALRNRRCSRLGCEVCPRRLGPHDPGMAGLDHRLSLRPETGRRDPPRRASTMELLRCEVLAGLPLRRRVRKPDARADRGGSDPPYARGRPGGCGH